MNKQTLAREMIQRLGLGGEDGLKVDQKTADGIDSEIMPTSISADYEALIVECFNHMGIRRDQIRISVRPVGVSPGGLDVYAAFVKVMRWDASVIDLLSRMPQVEKKVDRRIKLSSMLQYSNFVGLWFRSPANLHNLATTMH